VCKDHKQSQLPEQKGLNVMEPIIRSETAKNEKDGSSLQMDSVGFKTIVESTPIGVHMYKLTDDSELIFVYANAAADKTLGVDNSQFIGMRIEEAFPSLIYTEIPARYREVAISGKPWSTETIEYEDGKISGAFEIRAFHVSPRKVAVFFLEITERRIVDLQISNQRDFLEGVIESLTHPFYIIDANDYTIKMANKAARMKPTAEKQTCFSLTHRRKIPCSGTDHPCPLAEVKRTGRPVVVEHEHYYCDGSLRYHQVHGYPIFDSEGNIIQMIEYNLDVTEQRLVEQKLAEESKKSALYLDMLAHDVANQLQIISGSTELMSMANDSLNSHVQKKLLAQVNESVNKCKSTILRARLAGHRIM